MAADRVTVPGGGSTDTGAWGAVEKLRRDVGRGWSPVLSLEQGTTLLAYIEHLNATLIFERESWNRLYHAKAARG